MRMRIITRHLMQTIMKDWPDTELKYFFILPEMKSDVNTLLEMPILCGAS